MPITLSARDQQLQSQLLQKGLVSQALLDEVFQRRADEEAQALQQLKGCLYFVDPAQAVLVVLQLPGGEELARIPLEKTSAGAPQASEHWGKTQVLVAYQDGKESAQLQLERPRQGLVISEAGWVFVYPAGVNNPQLGLSNQLYSPEVATAEHEAYDLLAMPELGLLAVTHRWAGQLSLIDLDDHSFYGSFQIRPRGSEKALNITVDIESEKAYLTDNLSQSLSILDLNRKRLNVFQLPLGILGNLQLSPDARYLYLTVLKPRFALLYLEIDTLTEIKQLDLKGGSLCLDSPMPVDLMHLTPEQDLLLFVSYLDVPAPRTPVVQVIQTRKVRTIRRYALKASDGLQGLATALPNPAYLKPFQLSEALEKAGLAPAVRQQLQQQPAVVRPPGAAAAEPQPALETASEPGQPTQAPEAAASKAPPLTFAQEAEALILEMMQEQVQAQQQDDSSPLLRRQLRQQAAELRELLETAVEAQLELELSETVQLPFALSRQQLLTRMVKLNKPPSPLFLPQGICPICGEPKPLPRCGYCKFKLQAPRSRIQVEHIVSKRPAPVKAVAAAPKASLQLLRQVSFLATAQEQLLEQLSGYLHPQVFQPEEVVLSEGQSGNSMYFVVEGQLEVSKGEQRRVIATLQEGDVLGEMAMILSEPRSATVTALTECQLLRLERAHFLKVIIPHPEFSKQLREIAYRRKLLLQKYQRSQTSEVMERIKAKMAVNKLKAVFPQAPEGFFEAIANQVSSVAYLPATDVFLQGESAEQLFFISQGSVEVLVNGELVKVLSEGELFGEMACLLQQPRSATVHTRSYCKFLALQAADFQATLQHYPQVQGVLKELAQTRQHELDQIQAQQAEMAATQQPLPKLSLACDSYTPQTALYYLSPLEEQVFGLQHNQVRWAFGQSEEARLFQPQRAALDPQYPGVLLISDTGNDRILELDPTNLSVRRIWGGPQLSLSQPRAACFSAQGWLLIADEGHQRLLVANLQQELIWEHSEQVISPYHVSFTPEGHILYCDLALHQVIEINQQGQQLWSYGTALISGEGPDELMAPAFAARLDNGLTLIADTGNQRLLWVNAQKQVEMCWQGTAEAPLIEPSHCEWDAEGYLYVHSGSAENISCFSPAGELVWQATLLPA